MKWNQTVEEKARKRLLRLPTMDILNWCDQAGSGMARALDDYRRLNMDESLDEARDGARTLLVAIDVLQERHS